MVFVLIGVSAHPVWIGLIFSYFFGVRWHLTPIADYANFFGAPGSGEPGGPAQWAYHMILPWMTFALLFAALYVRMIRANVMETLNEDYVRTARAKGAPERRFRSPCASERSAARGDDARDGHWRRARGSDLHRGGFPAPGSGQRGGRRYQQRRSGDYQAVVVFSTFTILVFNLIVDLFYAWIDPRIRLSNRPLFGTSRSRGPTHLFQDRGRRRPAVDGVSFSSREGRDARHRGESGCGKSVTCLTIMGLNAKRNTISSGEALWKGRI